MSEGISNAAAVCCEIVDVGLGVVYTGATAAISNRLLCTKTRTKAEYQDLIITPQIGAVPVSNSDCVVVQ
jgi:hypothetical protein